MEAAPPELFSEHNDVLRAPQSQPDVLDLPIMRSTVDGIPVVVSKWIPSEDEIARILVGEPVFLVIYGRTHPPISLFAGQDSLDYYKPQ